MENFENIRTGFVKLYRSLLDFEWYDDINVMRVLVHCLLKANYKEKRWKGIIIKAGEFVTSIKKLSEETGLTSMQVRLALKKLEKSNFLTIKITNKFSLISIVNWGFYQSDVLQNNKQDNNQITNKQQTNNKQITTTKEIKNIRNKEYKNNNSAYNKVESIYKDKEGKKINLKEFKHKIIKIWNYNVPEDMKVDDVDDGTLIHILQQLIEIAKVSFLAKGDVYKAFEIIADTVGFSDFLTGQKEGSNFKASLRWLAKPGIIKKIYDGVYND